MCRRHDVVGIGRDLACVYIAIQPTPNFPQWGNPTTTTTTVSHELTNELIASTGDLCGKMSDHADAAGCPRRDVPFGGERHARCQRRRNGHMAYGVDVVCGTKGLETSFDVLTACRRGGGGKKAEDRALCRQQDVRCYLVPGGGGRHLAPALKPQIYTSYCERERSAVDVCTLVPKHHFLIVRKASIKSFHSSIGRVR